MKLLSWLCSFAFFRPISQQMQMLPNNGGLLFMAAGNYWMSQLNLDISPGQVVWPRVVVIVGVSVCFAPLNVAAYLYTPKELRGAAVGLLSLLRNEGGSVGTSLSQACKTTVSN